MWDLDHKEGWALKNWCFQIESPLDSKDIKPVNPKGNQPLVFLEGLLLKLNTWATWCEEPTHWKTPWSWERLRALKGETGDRGWDGWMASPTQWIWVWVNFEYWRWTGKSGVLQSMGSQRVGHDWVTELTHKTLSWFLYRNAAGQKRVAKYIQSPEREKC